MSAGCLLELFKSKVTTVTTKKSNNWPSHARGKSECICLCNSCSKYYHYVNTIHHLAMGFSCCSTYSSHSHPPHVHTHAHSCDHLYHHSFGSMYYCQCKQKGTRLHCYTRTFVFLSVWMRVILELYPHI